MDQYKNKSTIEEIRERFDNDVERFSNLETGQKVVIDAPLIMELITNAAVAATPRASRILDIGCGAGNNTIKLLELQNPMDCTLVDLSQPMLEKAKERIQEVNSGNIALYHGDFRETEFGDKRFDIIIAAAVLHHLRDDGDWQQVFEKIFSLCAPGGSVWISDLVSHDDPGVQELMWKRYGDFLAESGGEEIREKVFEYIEKEDTPRSVAYQTELLKKVGFSRVVILHKNSCFAAFGAVKK